MKDRLIGILQQPAGKVIAIDLDGTICEGEFWGEGEPTPKHDMIALIVSWYHAGAHIIIYTARQPKYYSVTQAWLMKHEVPFHGITMQMKPGAHVYIDDKALNLQDVAGTSVEGPEDAEVVTIPEDEERTFPEGKKEDKGPGRVYSCGLCSLQGHTRKTCKTGAQIIQEFSGMEKKTAEKPKNKPGRPKVKNERLDKPDPEKTKKWCIINELEAGTLSAEEIAKKCESTVATVYTVRSKAKKEGLYKEPKKDRSDDEQIENMLENGMGVPEIELALPHLTKREIEERIAYLQRRWPTFDEA